MNIIYNRYYFRCGEIYWKFFSSIVFFWMALFTWADIQMFDGINTNYIRSHWKWSLLSLISIKLENFLWISKFHKTFFFVWCKYQMSEINFNWMNFIEQLKNLFDINISQFVKFWKFNIHFTWCRDSRTHSLLRLTPFVLFLQKSKSSPFMHAEHTKEIRC